MNKKNSSLLLLYITFVIVYENSIFIYPF